MTAEDLWFGNSTLFSAIDAPPKITADARGYFDSMVLESGGLSVVRSYGQHRVLELGYPWAEASGATSVDLFTDYRRGELGPGPFWMANPIAFDTNVLEPRFASPMLCELDSPSIGASEPTSFAATAANSYSQPYRKGTWAVTTSANATPLTDATIPYTIVPIPTGFTLHIGCTGAATGTAVVKVESWANSGAAAGASASLSLLSETGDTRMNATVAGGTYAYAKVFITRTSSTASTITPISMMAQLHPSGDSPTLTGSHVRGRGFGGLEFLDDVVPEEFVDASSGRHYKALTVRLGEVGAWL